MIWFSIESMRALRTHHGMVISGRFLSFGRVERPLKVSETLSRDERLMNRSD